MTKPNEIVEFDVEEQVHERMRKIGGRKKNFMRESQAEEMESNDKIVIMHTKSDRGVENVDLILEPNKFDELSSKTRLSFEEFCDIINDFIEEEEADWNELRMKDQVNLTRDAILKATIMKYAETEYDIHKENYTGIDINFTKRYDTDGRFLGEAVTVTLTSIPMMGAIIR